jgi:G3E family GTPase
MRVARAAEKAEGVENEAVEQVCHRAPKRPRDQRDRVPVCAATLSSEGVAVSGRACVQVAFADRLLLNKTDLVSEADLVRIEKRLKSMNAVAEIVRCTKAAVSVDSVLDIGAFDLDRVCEMDPEFLNTEGEHVHDTSVSSVSIHGSHTVHARSYAMRALFSLWRGHCCVWYGCDAWYR